MRVDGWERFEGGKKELVFMGEWLRNEKSLTS